MYKKTITYTDYNDVERTEDFYFNLSKAELTEMEMSYNGGFVAMVNQIIAAKDTKTLTELFKELVLNAYGEKSLDGKHFVKSQEIREAFVSTEAYSELFVELTSSADAATAFVNGITPASIKPKN